MLNAIASRIFDKKEKRNRVTHICGNNMKRQRDVVFVPTLKEATKMHKKSKRSNRKGFSSVARARGAAVTGEMKIFDSALASAALPASNDWTGTEFDPTTLNTLFVPTVGAGLNQRIGKEVKVLKIKIRGQIVCPAQLNQTGADNPCLVRIALVQDDQTNASQMQGEQVFTTQADDALAINTFQNVDNFGRFKVLKDMLVTLQNPNMSYDGTNIEQTGLIKSFKITKTFKKPVVMRFNNTNGGSVADIVNHSFHIIANANEISLAPVINYVCRTNFKE